MIESGVINLKDATSKVSCELLMDIHLFIKLVCYI